MITVSIFDKLMTFQAAACMLELWMIDLQVAFIYGCAFVDVIC